MRDIKAEARPRKKVKKKKSLSPLLLVALLLVGAAGGYFAYTKKQSHDEKAREFAASQPTRFDEKPKKGVLRTLSGAEFRDLYNNFAYPNTQTINEDTPITGNPAADKRIRQVALKRGYLIRSAPVTDIFETVAPDMKLQQRAAQPWLDMQEAAKKDGQQLALTAAYRSAEDQKNIFLDKLSKSGISIQGIADGRYDDKLSDILRTTGVPGFSRHHTGYTIDIGCDNDPGVVFEVSSCFKWLSSDNYKNAKTYGWIPSYPDGAGEQGPDPESWEYVWVGVEALTE